MIIQNKLFLENFKHTYTMKKLIILSFFLALSVSIFAQTEVSGNQSGEWIYENSPYLVIDNITVLSGETLSIEPGVEVNFQGYYKFTIEGNLNAMGAIDDSILFTTNNQSIGWGGIRFNESDGVSNLSFCRIEYGKTAGDYPDIHGGAVALLTSDAIFSNCVFADNDATGQDNGMGGAIYGINTGNPTKFIDCDFIRNHAYGEGGAIKFTSDFGTEIIGCEFRENDCLYGGGAISLYSVVDTKMIFCLFIDNYTMYSSGGAIHTLGIGNSLILENCTLSNNTAVYGDGGGVYLAYANANFVNCIVYDNPGMYSDGIFVDIGSSAEINYCNTIMPDGATGSNNINVNPLFVDEANGNYQLDEGSLCIDAGIDIGYDFYGDAPDMGCFEYGLPTVIVAQNSEQNVIYPNPTNGIFNIQNPENVQQLILTNIAGKKVLEIDLSHNNESTIDISNFNRGVYLLSILSENNGWSTQKLILN